MQPDFATRAFNTALVRRTFPFARAFGVASLGEWQRLAERLMGKPPNTARHGAIVAEDPNGVVAGLFAYRLDETAIDGPALVCDPFWVSDLPRYAPPLNALLAEAERLSWRCGGRSILIALAAHGEPAGAEPTGCEAVLVRAGYALDRVAFLKRSVVRPIARTAPAHPGTGRGRE